MKKEELKLRATERLEALDIYKPYIRGFKAEDSKVCFFEGFGGFWVYQEPEIEAKMREIEKDFNCMVYAITHELTSIGELWDFICVDGSREDHIRKDGTVQYVKAYVWNVEDDFVEGGSIGVQSFGGGIRRVA